MIVQKYETDMRTQLHARARARTHTNPYKYTHRHTRTHPHTAHTNTHNDTRTQTHTNTRIYIHMYTRIHRRRHTHTKTHTHTSRSIETCIIMKHIYQFPAIFGLFIVFNHLAGIINQGNSGLICWNELLQIYAMYKILVMIKMPKPLKQSFSFCIKVWKCYFMMLFFIHQITEKTHQRRSRNNSVEART